MSLNKCFKIKKTYLLTHLKTIHPLKLSFHPFKLETLKIIFVSGVYLLISRPD